MRGYSELSGKKRHNSATRPIPESGRLLLLNVKGPVPGFSHILVLVLEHSSTVHVIV